MNNELRLTDEQVEKAARAGFGSCESRPQTWEECWEGTHEFWLNAVRAAAPFLQAPIADPTEEELKIIEAAVVQYERNHPGLRTTKLGACRVGASKFVEMRNAPATVDPRQDLVARIIHANDELSPQQIAAKVLAALDEAGK